MSIETETREQVDMEPLLNNRKHEINHNDSSTSITTTKKSYQYYKKLIFITLLYVVFLILDGVIGGVLFKKYEEIYSQYLNQATAFMYMIMSSIHMIIINKCSRSQERKILNNIGDANDIEEQEEISITKRTPWYLLVVIGVLNGTSNVFLAIGMPNTALLSQSLLGLLSLPVVLILSYLFLKIKGTNAQYCGAIFILIGTFLSSLHSIINGGGTNHTNGNPIYWYSTLFFALGNMGLGIERVFEHFVFKTYQNLHPMKMFMWTMYTQFFLYIFFLPTQQLSIFGGVEFKDIPEVMVDGVKCTFGISSTNENRPRCDSSNTYLFFSYCFVDFYVYFIGLYVIQKYGSSTMAVASALVIPIQQAVYCTFLVGKYIETFYVSDLIALIIVLIGYYFFEFHHVK